MSNIFRHTIYVSVLACGALVTACQSSSDKDPFGRHTPSVTGAKETVRIQAPATSAASEPTTHHRSVASSNATHAQPAAHAKASTDTNPKAATKGSKKPSTAASSGYSRYGEIGAAAGATKTTHPFSTP